MDDCTWMRWLYISKNKSDDLIVYKTFYTMIQTQFYLFIFIFGFYILTIVGSMYVIALSSTLQFMVLSMKLLVLKPLNKMGLMNKKTSETAQASLLGTHVPRFSWDEVVVSLVYLVNRMSSKVLDFQTPLQALSRFALLPFILMLPPRAFECVAFVHFNKIQCTKLDPCAVHYVFKGYEAHQKGY